MSDAESDAEKLNMVRVYVNELLIWNRNDATIATHQVATDILFLIGEK